MSVLVLLKRQKDVLIQAAIFRGYRSAKAAMQDRFQVPAYLSHVEITEPEDILLRGKLDRGEGIIIAWNDSLSTLYIDGEYILIRFSTMVGTEFRKLEAEQFFMFEAFARQSNMDETTAVLTIRE